MSNKTNNKADHLEVDEEEPLLVPARRFCSKHRVLFVIGLGAALCLFSLYYYSTFSLTNSLSNNKNTERPIVIDTTKCHPVELPKGARATNCCPPKPVSKSNVIDFKLPRPSSLTTGLRIRRAAHLLDDAQLAKYRKAVELMKALPDDDPRSFKQQANVHCAYCYGAYSNGKNDYDPRINVHRSWLFFPFHRFYLYFHERIMGKLLNDTTFALPFWNWDSLEGMQMPQIFTDQNSSLYDKYRNLNHQPPKLIDLEFNNMDPNITDQQQLLINLNIMYRQMVSNSKTASLFLGAPYRAGDEPMPGPGTIELVPHNSIHRWNGDTRTPNREDMGVFYSAARDPIFYPHHSNIDRLWDIWKTSGGKNRHDFDETDWLNASFEFYDENAELVRVKVKDSLDHTNLGYDYEKVDIPWLAAKPTPRKIELKLMNKTMKFPKVLSTKFSSVVKRPGKSRSKKEKEEEEEILIVEMIELEMTDEFVKFDVYVNDAVDSESGPNKTEFAGSFVNLPHAYVHKGGTNYRTSLFRVGITELMEELEVDNDDTLMVTLVPKSGIVTIGGIKIEYGS
ncbi:Polyphenol oxidase [Quillaja saponaria]|uniref:Polyphenol oxidase n=1 Tax=Quillaja saponaria TaxID=32244 RepID=A0AAD7P9Q6_QUISA|nr:Polyphenol oxidase [Quillaja saponaria]